MIVGDGWLVPGYLRLMGEGILPVDGSFNQISDDEGFNAGEKGGWIVAWLWTVNGGSK